MKRGSFCYFCGTELVAVDEDADGACFECEVCPPVVHWRWNEDTEFLQLYVAGERCPYCGTYIPESVQEDTPPVRMPEPVMVAVAVSEPKAETAPAQPVAGQRRQGGKPVTVDGVWWDSVVQWCRTYNGHDIRKPHNCSKELARMQARGEAEVVWHNRDRIPGSGELITSRS